MANTMDIKKCKICEKFYDVNSYETCPHCGGSKNDSESVNNEFKKNESSKGLWGRLKKDKKEKTEKTGDVDDKIISGTLNFENTNKNEDFKTVQEIEKNEEENQKIYNHSNDIELTPVTPNKEIMKKPEKREYVKEVQNDDEMKTVQVYNTPNEPVVGWLVCVKGACMGDSYTIRSGNNKIGRNRDNDIVIEDSTISREQAVIMFEPRKQKFHLIPNPNASKFMYINDDEVIERMYLEPYTHIEIGENVEFVFVPFCGEHFNWKDYEED